MGDLSFVSVGDLMIDITVAGRGHASRVALGAGGAAANAAVWAAASGADSTVVGRVGDDLAGRALRAAFEERGVRADLSVDPEAPTGTFLVVDGEIRADRGANANLGPDNLPDRLEGDAVLVSGYAPREAVEAALERARGDWVALAPAFLEPPLPHGADTILLDEVEARRLTGLGPEEAARTLGQTFRLACVTRAAAGAVAALAGHLETSPAAAVQAAESAGAGDAFAAGLLVTLVRGADLAQALETACRLGATVAASSGHWPPLPVGVQQ
jgi:sugar/nucleoside kinase (ribokinase family)